MMQIRFEQQKSQSVTCPDLYLIQATIKHLKCHVKSQPRKKKKSILYEKKLDTGLWCDYKSYIVSHYCCEHGGFESRSEPE